MEQKNIPRRMKRFYRANQNATISSTSRDNYSGDSQYREDEIGNIPTMEYEDLDKHVSDQNKKELQRIEQTNMEQKLTLFEIEKFKKENKRLPNKKEVEQIADNLYNQFKESGTLSNEPRQRNKRDRGNRGNTKEDTPIEERMPPSKRKRIQREKNMQEEINHNSDIIPKGNIKDLFNSSEKIGKKLDAEFNLNLGEEKETTEIEDLEDMETSDDFNLKELDEGKNCPNCKAKTDKIIYCPKCGSAFCEKCGTINGEKICPKCKAKV